MQIVHIDWDDGILIQSDHHKEAHVPRALASRHVPVEGVAFYVSASKCICVPSQARVCT